MDALFTLSAVAMSESPSNVPASSSSSSSSAAHRAATPVNESVSPNAGLRTVSPAPRYACCCVVVVLPLSDIRSFVHVPHHSVSSRKQHSVAPSPFAVGTGSSSSTTLSKEAANIAASIAAQQAQSRSVRSSSPPVHTAPPAIVRQTQYRPVTKQSNSNNNNSNSRTMSSQPSQRRSHKVKIVFAFRFAVRLRVNGVLCCVLWCVCAVMCCRCVSFR